MAKRKTVGIKELKNNLSAYFRDVRHGTRVYVSDREKVVAELHEPGTVYATDEDPNPVLAAWLRAGIVTFPKRPMNEAEIRMTSALTIVEAERANWTTMSLTPGVLTRAGRAFPIEPVRTLEAIHLAPA